MEKAADSQENLSMKPSKLPPVDTERFGDDQLEAIYLYHRLNDVLNQEHRQRSQSLNTEENLLKLHVDEDMEKHRTSRRATMVEEDKITNFAVLKKLEIDSLNGSLVHFYVSEPKKGKKIKKPKETTKAAEPDRLSETPKYKEGMTIADKNYLTYNIARGVELRLGTKKPHAEDAPTKPGERPRHRKHSTGKDEKMPLWYITTEATVQH